jgi:hypothetical protein
MQGVLSPEIHTSDETWWRRGSEDQRHRLCRNFWRERPLATFCLAHISIKATGTIIIRCRIKIPKLLTDAANTTEKTATYVKLKPT